MIFALICLLLLVFSSCEAPSNSTENFAPIINDVTKFKITYLVDSAYFTLPEDAPKYHIYGTDTVLPVPVEKNVLPKLMKTKFWSDGAKDGIGVLGGKDYTSDITVEYKFSFDTEKCADGYIMLSGSCVTPPASSIIGGACANRGEISGNCDIHHGIIECGNDNTWQFVGCELGYKYINGICVASYN